MEQTHCNYPFMFGDITDLAEACDAFSDADMTYDASFRPDEEWSSGRTPIEMMSC